MSDLLLQAQKNLQNNNLIQLATYLNTQKINYNLSDLVELKANTDLDKLKQLTFEKVNILANFEAQHIEFKHVPFEIYYFIDR